MACAIRPFGRAMACAIRPFGRAMPAAYALWARYGHIAHTRALRRLCLRFGRRAPIRAVIPIAASEAVGFEPRMHPKLRSFDSTPYDDLRILPVKRKPYLHNRRNFETCAEFFRHQPPQRLHFESDIAGLNPAAARRHNGANPFRNRRARQYDAMRAQNQPIERAANGDRNRQQKKRRKHVRPPRKITSARRKALRCGLCSAFRRHDA